ncbi:3945_t:CDS:2, partial [Racocetra persica]
SVLFEEGGVLDTQIRGLHGYFSDGNPQVLNERRKNELLITNRINGLEKDLNEYNSLKLPTDREISQLKNAQASKKEKLTFRRDFKTYIENNSADNTIIDAYLGKGLSAEIAAEAYSCKISAEEIDGGVAAFAERTYNLVNEEELKNAKKDKTFINDFRALENLSELTDVNILAYYKFSPDGGANYEEDINPLNNNKYDAYIYSFSGAPKRSNRLLDDEEICDTHTPGITNNEYAILSGYKFNPLEKTKDQALQQIQTQQNSNREYYSSQSQSDSYDNKNDSTSQPTYQPTSNNNTSTSEQDNSKSSTNDNVYSASGGSGYYPSYATTQSDDKKKENNSSTPEKPKQPNSTAITPKKGIAEIT